MTSYSSVASSPRYSRSQVAPAPASRLDASTQQAFINEVAPGALAAQRQYGIPAAVTIAQAIDESGWGQSQLAAEDNNLFGIKGTGPAGSVLLPTQEFENGQYVNVNAPFRVYSDVAQSINDHSVLLATGSAYQQAMADRRSPDTFANDLTGVYATDPNYGATLITIMRHYNLYRFDAGSSAGAAPSTPSESGQGDASSAPSGSVLSGSGLSGALSAGAEQDAAIPGAMAVNAAALGIPAQQTSQHSTGLSASRQRPAGQSEAAHRRAGHGGGVPRGSASAGPGGSSGLKGAATGSSGASGLVTGGSGSNGAVVGRSGPGGTASDQVGADARGSDTEGSGGASIPGLDDYAGTAAASSTVGSSAAGGANAHLRPTVEHAVQAGPRNLHVSTRRYVTQMPRTVLTDFITTAKIPLLRAKPTYQDVAARSGMRWELLAACDWMQCQAQPGVSPVYGENLGTKNPDGTVYRTKADALEQCAADLIELAAAVYGINLRHRLLLSVRDLASVFAAFRWGGLLKAHRISAMDFPYSVEGLSAQYMKMRWPDIGEEAPDKPGTRFRMSFGAVPVVLRLGYPAIA